MRLIWTIQTFRWSDVPDVLVVAALIFAAGLYIRGTQAVPLLRGTLVVVLVIGFFATTLEWVAFRWVLNNLLTAAAVAIPIIFQPELRRALERVGRTGLNNLFSRAPTYTADEQVIDAICAAAARLSERRHGALIVLERNDTLEEFIKTGVPLDAEVSPQLFLTVFWPKTELHDGAVIIRNGRVASAASCCRCRLAQPDDQAGTRHRAGLGISEVSDALTVIISEETGASPSRTGAA